MADQYPDLFQRLKYPSLAFLLAFAVLFAVYYKVILDPNGYIFASGGDGIKNYYTYMFHARYDTSFWDFGGMNYPFYENIVYMDAHPLLSWIIGNLGLTNYGVGILNLLILLSYPICAVFIYLIFRHFKVANLWAILGSVAVTFMSPQVFRMTGHLSLSYVFAIPAVWWFMLKYIETKKFIWSVIIGLFVLLFFFTHPYLGLILCSFIFATWFVRSLLMKGTWKTSLMSILIQIIVPILIFQWLVTTLDTHADRMATPGGFYNYYAHWSSILLPHHGPLNYLKNVLEMKSSNWESWSYIGFSTIVFFVTIIVHFIRKRKSYSFKTLLHHPLVVFGIAAYLILMFAFCIPMKWDFMRWMTDVFGPLKQFRVLGRFTWVFFYFITIASVIAIYRIKLKSEKKLVFDILFYVGIIFYVFEFVPTHNVVSSRISKSANVFNYESLDQDLKEVSVKLKEGEYDAIIFLPFDHMSSENIMLLGTENSGRDATLLSYHTGIPLLNSMSSRMSVIEAILFNTFFGPEFVEKELVKYFPPDAKIAVVRNKDYMKEAELMLEWSSDKIYENERLILLNYNNEKWNNSFYFDKIVEKEKKATYSVGAGWFSDTNSVWFIYEDFEDESINRLGGKGAMKDQKNVWNTIITLDNTMVKPGNYSVSFWYDIRSDRADGLAIAEQVFKSGAEPVWIDQFDMKQATHIVEDWCQVKMNFNFTSDLEAINILIMSNNSKAEFFVDELLIQKENGPDLFKREESGGQEYIVYNNYWIKANSFSK